MSKILITGVSSGIGEAIALALLADNTNDHIIYGTYHDDPSELLPITSPRMTQLQIDFNSVDPTDDLIAYCVNSGEELDIDILINCAGTNYINWLEQTRDSDWDRIMNVNAKGIFLMARYFMDSLIMNKGTMLNIVSNASHMPMTNSIAYNASKGAAHIMTLQLARELGPKGVTIFGISPNRVGNTGMSDYIDKAVCGIRGWTKEYAREYQLSALPAGEETDKDVLGEFIAFILSSKERHKYMAGTVIPYGK